MILVSKLIKIVLGILFVALGILAIISWWGDVLILIRGGIGFVLILLGLICFAILD